MSDSKPSVRDVLLAGLFTAADLAKALNVCEGTILNLKLPYVKIGGRRYYDLEKTRAAILAGDTAPRALARGWGRPRKSA